MLGAWIELARPRQWVKNLFLLAPLVFARQLFEPRLLGRALAGTAVFCLLSSAVYLLNDVFDAAADRAHPLKKNRPLAAGRLRAGPVAAAGAALGLVALGLAWLLGPGFGASAAGYLALNLLYSSWLKRLAFVDVAVIAAGFVLRVVGGAEVIPVPVSPWLVVCTFCLALLLGLGKRRHEMRSGGGAGSRDSLAGYRERAAARLQWAAAAVTVLGYLAYTLDAHTVAKFGTRWLAATAVFPPLGIWRYLVLVERRGLASPTDALVSDPVSWLVMAGWMAVVLAVVY